MTVAPPGPLGPQIEQGGPFKSFFFLLCFKPPDNPWAIMTGGMRTATHCSILSKVTANTGKQSQCPFSLEF